MVCNTSSSKQPRHFLSYFFSSPSEPLSGRTVIIPIFKPDGWLNSEHPQGNISEVSLERWIGNHCWKIGFGASFPQSAASLLPPASLMPSLQCQHDQMNFAVSFPPRDSVADKTMAAGMVSRWCGWGLVHRYGNYLEVLSTMRAPADAKCFKPTRKVLQSALAETRSET